MIKHSQKGDTIVEVLIAITVISGVLGAAYGTMNRASQNVLLSQERGVATKLLESQAENLKAAVASIPGAGPFCFDETSTIKTAFPPGFSVIPPLDSDPLTAYAAAGCAFDQAGATYSSAGITYNLAITRTGSDFTIHCRWAGIGQQGNQEATISYRVYQ